MSPDPYAEGEHDTGRLPKIIDDWIVSQIQAGKGPEDIRRLLQMTPEEKDAVGDFSYTSLPLFLLLCLQFR
jgi:hypothetical protein